MILDENLFQDYRKPLKEFKSSEENYCVYSSSDSGCYKRFTGTEDECKDWIKNNRRRFPSFVHLSIQAESEPARWMRDFDVSVYHNESIARSANGHKYDLQLGPNDVIIHKKTGEKFKILKPQDGQVRVLNMNNKIVSHMSNDYLTSKNFYVESITGSAVDLSKAKDAETKSFSMSSGDYVRLGEADFNNEELAKQLKSQGYVMYRDAAFASGRDVMYVKGPVTEGWIVKYVPEAGDVVTIIGSVYTNHRMEWQTDTDEFIGAKGTITYVGSRSSKFDTIEIELEDGTTVWTTHGYRPVKNNPIKNESKSIKEEVGDNYSNNIEYCPNCGWFLDGGDISYEWDDAVRYTCYNCGNTFDRDKYYNESKSIKESAEEDKPYSSKEVEQELKSITNNWRENDGVCKCWYKEEKQHAVKILKQHYKIVETSQDGNWIVIAFETPIQKESMLEDYLRESNYEERAAGLSDRSLYDMIDLMTDMAADYEGESKYTDYLNALKAEKTKREKEAEYKNSRRAKRDALGIEGKYPYYITLYHEYPIYEPAEGGYYYAGLEAHSAEGYNSFKEAAQAISQAAEELVDSGYHFVKKSAGEYRDYGDKHIGTGAILCIENNKQFGSRERGYQPYE